MIVIHGLGYVGLTAAVHLALAGHEVVGYDPDERTVDGINAGRPRAGEFLSYLDTSVADLVSRGLLRATGTFDDVRGATVHVVAVPTERAGEPDDTIVTAVIRQLDRPGTLILVESTLVPGTIDRLLPLRANLAVCPRRDWFADPEKNLRTLPRVVGGVTAACTERAASVLRGVSPNLLLTDYRTAELTKSLENALLHVQVMFVQQLAVAYPGHNVAEAVRLAGTHWRLTPLHLGFGTGGRCVPLGTEYLLRGAPGNGLHLAQSASDWDDWQREHIARLVCRHAHTVLVLGIAYRPDFRDAGRSPGLAVARAMRRHEVEVRIHDPMWTVLDLQQFGVPVAGSIIPSMYDAVLLATPHRAYADLPTWAGWRSGQFVLDAQGAWAGYREVFRAAGVDYRIVGEPEWAE